MISPDLLDGAPPEVLRTLALVAGKRKDKAASLREDVLSLLPEHARGAFDQRYADAQAAFDALMVELTADASEPAECR